MFSTRITPRFYETDAFGHVNNTVINCWFESARMPIFDLFADGPEFIDMNLILARTEVDFIAQTYYGKEVEVTTCIERIGNSSFVVAHQAFQEGRLVARGKAVQVHFDQRQQQAIPLSESLRQQLSEWMTTDDH